MERLVAILEENKKKREKISIIPRGNLPTGGIFIGNNWIVIRIRLGGGGERISTNFEAVRTGLRLFDISNVPLLISYASTNINLSFESENQAGLSLSLSPPLSGFRRRKQGEIRDPARDNKDTGTFTADPYNSLHPAGISLTRLQLCIRGAPLPPSPRFLVHGHV